MRKTLTAFIRRADEGTLSRLLIESSTLLAASRGNPTVILKEAATAYKVDTDAISTNAKQEFAAKEKAKKTAKPATNTAKKAAQLSIKRGAAFRRPSSFCTLIRHDFRPLLAGYAEKCGMSRH